MSSRQKFLLIGLAVVVVAVSISIWLLSLRYLPSRLETPQDPAEEIVYVDAHEAYRIAESRVKAWDENAELVWLETLEGASFDGEGGSTLWRLRFSETDSPQTHRGYEIVVENGKVSRTADIQLSQRGGEFTDRLKTTGGLVSIMRTIPGYEAEPVLGFSLRYEASGEGSWHWGIATSRGVMGLAGER